MPKSWSRNHEVIYCARRVWRHCVSEVAEGRRVEKGGRSHPWIVLLECVHTVTERAQRCTHMHESAGPRGVERVLGNLIESCLAGLSPGIHLVALSVRGRHGAGLLLWCVKENLEIRR
jgi:hypothetical protein